MRSFSVKIATSWQILKLISLVVSKFLFARKQFCDGEVGDKTSSMNAIRSPPEAADNVISGKDVETFRCYACVNLWVANFSNFRENLNQSFM